MSVSTDSVLPLVQVETDEVKLVQHAINKYRLESHSLELKATSVYKREGCLTTEEM